MCHGCDTSKYGCVTGCVTHKTLFKHMKRGFYSKKCRSDTSFYYYYIYKYALVLKNILKQFYPIFERCDTFSIKTVFTAFKPCFIVTK